MKTNALLILVSVFMCQPALGDSAEAPAAQRLEEVVVHGKKRAELRMDLHHAEDRFFEVFNSLNSDDDYDIGCDDRAPVGSRIKRRVCEARFVGELSSLAWSAVVRGSGAVAPAFMAQMSRKERLLVREMRELVVVHPELQQALEDVLRARGRIANLHE